MRSPLATIACACLLLGGCSKSAEDSANPLLGKDAECLELFARSNALYCDIREDERESQANGTPRRHTDYEVADAAYLLKATGSAARSIRPMSRSVRRRPGSGCRRPAPRRRSPSRSARAQRRRVASSASSPRSQRLPASSSAWRDQ